MARRRNPPARPGKPTPPGGRPNPPFIPGPRPEPEPPAESPSDWRDLIPQPPNPGERPPFPGRDDPDRPPLLPPGPGMEWVWDGQQWVRQPIGEGGSGGEDDLTDPTNPPEQGAPEGYRWEWNADLGRWVLVQVEEEGGEESGNEAARGSARVFLQGLFEQFGFSADDITALMGLVDGWISEGLADVGTDAILMKFRGTDVYKRRFAGMQALIDRGQAISEAEYVELERGYRRVLSSYGLPKEFYDNYDDYAKFIANDVSVNEVEERVFAARQMLDNSDPRVLNELQDYYGVTSGGALAYLLDAEKAQQTIRQQVRAAQIGGSAERYGFNMDRMSSERLGASTVGGTIDPFDARSLAQLESTFASARRTADRERVLSGIDAETWTETDTLDAAFGDDTKRLASERRGRRERARFSGTSGAGRSALSQSRNF